MIIVIKIPNHLRQSLGYHVFPVIRKNDSLQCTNISRNRELNKFTQPNIELNLEIFVMLVGLIPYLIQTPLKHNFKLFLVFFLVTTLQFA